VRAPLKFHKSALARYTPADFVRLVRQHRIAYHEKKLGQLFCDGTSQQIVDMLLRECREAGVDLRLNCSIRSIEKRNGRFLVSDNQTTHECQSLVIASGGLSIPKLGASRFGYNVARQFGLRIAEVRPALVPLTLGGEEGRMLKDLAGVSPTRMRLCPQSPPIAPNSIAVTTRCSAPARRHFCGQPKRATFRPWICCLPTAQTLRSPPNAGSTR
jgi:predicted flavoprotein YhiN